MGFLEKVKNMFTEEIEEDEVKVEKVDKVKKEIIASFNESIDDNKEEEKSLEEEVKKPVFFDDDEFSDIDYSEKKVFETKSESKDLFDDNKLSRSREDKHIKRGNYKEMMKDSFDKRVGAEEEREPEEKKIFKPTPIISPIYGVLDKNYHKEDIVSKNDIKNESKSEPLIDQIRNKAYGTLEDELEDTLFGKNSVLKRESEVEEEDSPSIMNDLDNLTEDISKELDDLLVKKEKKKASPKTKKVNDNDSEDFLDFIDSTLYKDEGEE